MNIGLVFGMIVAIVMIVAILVFGYDQITKMQQLQREAEFLRVMQSFEDAVDSVYNLGGESSKRFTMSLPSGYVTRTCFVPLFSIDCYPAPCTREHYDKAEVRSDVNNMLRSQLEYGSFEASQISDVMSHAWELEKPTVLVFYVGKRAPVWFNIPHLAPSKKPDEILCVNPGERVVLRRYFDDAGAWVDIEEI
ncbi:MAG: hypothetical protein JSV63_04400 [Candidatus Aenigmatarchaeota archaeon]|nr:MAG: hypothetical protein JSV63_04400 [Candidatus Aenigmarchaeota archaeon]